MKRLMIALGLVLLVVSAGLYFDLEDTSGDSGSTTEIITVVEEGWRCALSSDGDSNTAMIVDSGKFEEWIGKAGGKDPNKVHRIPSTVEYEVNNIKYNLEISIPTKVHYGDKEYTVTGLGPYLFSGGNASSGDVKKVRYFEYVEIPSTIEKIGKYCFSGNNGVLGENKEGLGLEIVLEKNSSLKEIEEYAFWNAGSKELQNRKGTEVTRQLAPLKIGIKESDEAGLKEFLPGAIKIYDYAFNGSGLESIDLTNVSSIGNYAFEYCSNLKTIANSSDLSDGELVLDAGKIGSYIFGGAVISNKGVMKDGCAIENLKKISIPKCTDISRLAFKGLPGVIINYPMEKGNIFQTVTVSGTFVLWNDGDEVMIDSFEKDPNYNEEAMVLPAAITKLDDMTGVLGSFTTISFDHGSKLRIIGNKSCIGLNIRMIDFSNATQLEVIGDQAFQNCNLLENLDLSMCNKLVSLGQDAFNNCGLTNVMLPIGLETIGKASFKNNNITSINLKNINIQVIADEAFKNGLSEGISEIDFSGVESLASIGENAFADNSFIKVNLKGCSKLTALGDFNSCVHGFILDISGCSSLETVGVLNPSCDECREDGQTCCVVIHDESTSHVVEATATNQGQNINFVGVARWDKSILKIEKTDFAIPRNAIEGKLAGIECESPYYVYENGMLMNSERTVLYKVVWTGSVVEIPQTVGKIYPFAFSSLEFSNEVILLRDVDSYEWARDGVFNASLFVESTCNDARDNLSKMDVNHSVFWSVGEYNFYLKSELNRNIADPSVIVEGSKVSVSMKYGNGYSKHDIYLYDGQREYVFSAWKFTVSSNMELTIKAYPREGTDVVRITFDSSGGSFEPSGKDVINLPRGLSIIDSDVPVLSRDGYDLVGWTLNGVDYDFDSPLTADITLVAKWEYRGVKLTFDSVFGEISAFINGSAVESGINLKDSTAEITFDFTPSLGYILKNWVVNGENAGNQELSLSSLNGDTSVSVEVYSYSADQVKSLVFDSGAHDLDEYSLSWSFGKGLDASTMVWRNHPSTPVIVDGYAYIRIAERIYKISIETGFAEASVESVDQTSYYHHIGFGNGMIIDYATGIVYDENLKPLFKLSGTKISYLQYHDGKLIGLVDGVPTAYDASKPDGSTVETRGPYWKSNATGWFELYGTASTPIVNGGYLYFVYTAGSSIGLKSVSLQDGKQVDYIQFGRLNAQYLDDGWLTYYDGKIFLTSYAYGLFGSTATSYKASVITSVPISEGQFDDGSVKHMELRDTNGNLYDSLTSQLVVFNGRGYVNVSKYNGKASLFVIDMKTMSVIYTQDTVVSHGSIVVDASSATASNSYAVSIYIVGYNDSKVCVVTDHAGKTKATGNAISKNISGTYCSQAVRFGPNGEMIWYDDSGFLHCYSATVARNIFIQGEENSIWIGSESSTLEEVLKSAEQNLVKIDNKTKTISSVYGETGTWEMYVYKGTFNGNVLSYGWVKIENLLEKNSGVYHYMMIKSPGAAMPQNGETYSYIDNGSIKEYEFSDNVGSEIVIGKELIKKHASEVVIVKFIDDEGKEIKSYLEIKDKSIMIKYPIVSKDGFVAKWYDNSVRAPKGQTILNEDKTYILRWMEASTYSLEVTKIESGSMNYYNVKVTRTSGSQNLDDMRLLIIGEYESKIFVNSLTKVNMNDTTSDETFGLSTSGLLKIHVYVVDGEVVGSFDRYGECTLTYAE